MLKIKFTEEEIKQLHHEYIHHKHPKVRRRCEEAHPPKTISEAVDRIEKLVDPLFSDL